MAFITGLFLIDAPASALNNLGNIPGERTDNVVGVKVIRAKDGYYPYVSAQAFRYWLRSTLDCANLGWRSAPVYREEKIAYTDANPIEYWDDDLFGYMRAPSQKETAKAKRAADGLRANETPTADTITRVSPFRVSTLVSIAPVKITEDFGVMARQDDYPVPHEHQFYHTTLKGLFSLNLHTSGAFSYSQKTGYRNLDEVRIKLAKEKDLELVEDEKSYRLPKDERIQRISTLLEGLSQLEGGAKQTLHYTDVAPAFVILAVTKGGNHIFGHVTGANSTGQPEIKLPALDEAMSVFADEILSPIYIGWVRGYLDSERAKVEEFFKDNEGVRICHPRAGYQALIQDLQNHPEWLD
jgi:CRISPR-associated protein Cst2